MAKDPTKPCPPLKAVLELTIEVLKQIKGNSLVFKRQKRLFDRSALEGKEIASPGRGVEGNKSDLQRIEEIIPQISELMANLLITNGEGEIDREQMRRISVKVGKLSTKLLEVSLDGGEISEDSIQKKLLRYEIDAILREVIFNR